MAIGQALSMPLDERRSRHQALFQMLLTRDVRHWSERFPSASLPPESPSQLHLATIPGQIAPTIQSFQPRAEPTAHIAEGALRACF